jgi:hypothetical protein
MGYLFYQIEGFINDVELNGKGQLPDQLVLVSFHLLRVCAVIALIVERRHMHLVDLEVEVRENFFVLVLGKLLLDCGVLPTAQVKPPFILQRGIIYCL